MRKLFSLLLAAMVCSAAFAQANLPPFNTSQFNGEIMVDGVVYATLDGAWQAALRAAANTNRNQTIRLGAGNYFLQSGKSEPLNGTCVSVVGSAAPGQNDGTAISGNIFPASTVINYGGTGTMIFSFSTVSGARQVEDCTFRDLNIVTTGNGGSAFFLTNMRGLTIENVTVNDAGFSTSPSAAVVIGDGSADMTEFNIRNLTVSYSASHWTPASRPHYGVYLNTNATDGLIDGLYVRNAQQSALYNAGSGLRARNIHGFGFPYTCTTGPCNNTTETNPGAADASYASNFVVQDYGTGGNVYTDTYIDSPAEAGFDVGANGVAILGGHIQWPELVSFPNANLAWVESAVTSNLIIANIGCTQMSSTAGAPSSPAGNTGVWISYFGTAGQPPSFSSVSNLAGCGTFYAQRQNARQTVFDVNGNNSSNTNFGSTGETPKVLAFPLSTSAAEGTYEAEQFTGGLGDLYYGGFKGQPSSYAVRPNGTIHAGGGLQTNAVSVTSATSLTYVNKNVMANASAGAFTITLPSCFTPMEDGLVPLGMEMTIYKVDSGANAVTLATTSSQTINYQGVTASTLVISTAGSRTLVCGSDSNWYAR